VSPTVHALPSLQVEPLVAATQVPVADEQTLQVPQAEPTFCQVPVESQDCG